MRKVLLPLIVGLLLAAVVGCTGATPITPDSNVPTRTPAPVATEDSPTAEPTEPTEPVNPPDNPIESDATCNVVPSIGVPVNGLPAVTAADHTLGSSDAPVTLIEYTDYQ